MSGGMGGSQSEQAASRASDRGEGRRQQDDQTDTRNTNGTAATGTHRHNRGTHGTDVQGIFPDWTASRGASQTGGSTQGAGRGGRNTASRRISRDGRTVETYSVSLISGSGASSTTGNQPRWEESSSTRYHPYRAILPAIGTHSARTAGNGQPGVPTHALTGRNDVRTPSSAVPNTATGAAARDAAWMRMSPPSQRDRELPAARLPSAIGNLDAGATPNGGREPTGTRPRTIPTTRGEPVEDFDDWTQGRNSSPSPDHDPASH